MVLGRIPIPDTIADSSNVLIGSPGGTAIIISVTFNCNGVFPVQSADADICNFRQQNIFIFPFSRPNFGNSTHFDVLFSVKINTKKMCSYSVL